MINLTKIPEYAINAIYDYLSGSDSDIFYFYGNSCEIYQVSINTNLNSLGITKIDFLNQTTINIFWSQAMSEQFPSFDIVNYGKDDVKNFLDMVLDRIEETGNETSFKQIWYIQQLYDL